MDEGWLKGELVYFLDKEKEGRRITDVSREVPIGELEDSKKKVDIKIKVPKMHNKIGPSPYLDAWIELKYLLIGNDIKIKGRKCNAQFYFSHPKWIRSDAEKLSRIQGGGKFLLILNTANPDIDDWSTGIDRFNKRSNKESPSICLKSLTDPKDFPDYYYLGLLTVDEKTK